MFLGTPSVHARSHHNDRLRCNCYKCPHDCIYILFIIFNGCVLLCLLLVLLLIYIYPEVNKRHSIVKLICPISITWSSKMSLYQTVKSLKFSQEKSPGYSSKPTVWTQCVRKRRKWQSSAPRDSNFLPKLVWWIFYAGVDQDRFQKMNQK